MANQDEEQPFTPSLTEARLPSVDHMFNQGMLNVILDRTFGGPPAGVPRERPGVGLSTSPSATRAEGGGAQLLGQGRRQRQIDKDEVRTRRGPRIAPNWRARTASGDHHADAR
jgi:hypothetical protein